MHDLNQALDLERILNSLAERVADRVERRVIQCMQRKFISREEFAQQRGIGIRSVDRAIAQGRLESTQVGRRRLIPIDAVIQE